jgi:tetratricopeptide (TPR) repeat protein
VRSRLTAARPLSGSLASPVVTWVAISVVALVTGLGVRAATLAWDRRSLASLLQVRPARASFRGPVAAGRPLLSGRGVHGWNRSSDRLGDGNPVTAFERGVAAYNADDPDAAADAFEEAVRLAPEASEAHINLGLVYLRLQRPEDAMRELMTGAALARGLGEH